MLDAGSNPRTGDRPFLPGRKIPVRSETFREYVVARVVGS